MNERRQAAAAPIEPPPRDTDHDAVPIDLADIEEVSAAGRRVSLASLNKLAPVGKFGKYHLLGRLAYGGMAEIFLAREVQTDGGETRLGRFCVVKRVLPHVANDRQFVAMFMDEARLVVQLSHPNICHVYAYGEEEGASYIAMEWVNGMPLSKMLRRSRDRGGIALAITLKIIAMVAEALDHAHRAVDQSSGDPLGIVHRDVSPQNVMVAFDGVVKLLDFGIAKAASHSTRTEAGVVKGKFAYMSPQQCMGEPIDARSDIFALGVVLYEMIDGTNPFKKSAEFDTMRALVYDVPPPLTERHPHVPEEIDAIVAKAIAKKPEDRFQTASELQLAIERALGRMGEVVTTAHIGARMHEIFEAEIRSGPRLDTRITVPEERKDATGTSEAAAKITPRPNATEKVTAIPEHALATPAAPASDRNRVVVPALVGLVLVLISALAGMWMLSGGPAPTSVASGAPPPPTTTIVAPSEQLGTIYVNSSPPGATIRLGSRGEVGRTPMEVARLPPGEWTVHLALSGYDNWDGSVSLTAGQRVEVVQMLTASPVLAAVDPVRPPPTRTARPHVEHDDPPPPSAAAAPAHLAINTRPWSRVFVGSRLLGTTPIGGVEVPSGSLRLRFVDRDGVEHSRTINIPAGGEAREFFDLTTDVAP
jgi:serine/threonine protein kinase